MSTEEKPSRGNQWFLTFVTSLIALVAITSTYKVVGGPTYLKWAASGLAVALGLAGLAVLAHAVVKSKFVGTPIEGGLAIIVFGFLAAVMPAVMKPDNLLAVGQGGGVFNANLYFFIWGSFFSALFVLVHYLGSAFKVGVGKNTNFRAGMWAALCLASFVVFVNAVRIYQDSSCKDSVVANAIEQYCNRTKWAVSLGVISAGISLFWVFLGACVPGIIDTIVSLMLFVMWVFGIIFITFGAQSPGRVVGNLYFFTWFGFLISFMVTSMGIGDYMNASEQAGEAEDAPAAKTDAEEDKPKEEEGEKAEGEEQA